jgi:hypothetical protein
MECLGENLQRGVRRDGVVLQAAYVDWSPTGLLVESITYIHYAIARMDGMPFVTRSLDQHRRHPGKGLRLFPSIG